MNAWISRSVATSLDCQMDDMRRTGLACRVAPLGSIKLGDFAYPSYPCMLHANLASPGMNFSGARIAMRFACGRRARESKHCFDGACRMPVLVAFNKRCIDRY